MLLKTIKQPRHKYRKHYHLEQDKHNIKDITRWRTMLFFRTWY